MLPSPPSLLEISSGDCPVSGRRQRTTTCSTHTPVPEMTHLKAGESTENQSLSLNQDFMKALRCWLQGMAQRALLFKGRRQDLQLGDMGKSF